MLEQIAEVNEKFNSFTESVFESEILNDKEKAIVALATVIAFEDEEGVKNAIMNAKQCMISNEEIAEIMAIVIAMRSKKISKLGSQGGNCCSSGGRCC